MTAEPSGVADRQLAEELVRDIGDSLYQALRSGDTVEPLTDQYPQMGLSDAYAISQHFLALRCAAGERLIGKKIGVTSEAVQTMLNVFQPDFGFLTDVMDLSESADIPIQGQLIAPRIEAEIGFWLKDTLTGPGITEADVLAATDAISPCFEIVDSRIRDWQIKIEDTVADNASCGVFVVGPERVSPQGMDLAALHITVEKNGQAVAEGYGSAVQGNPLTAVAWLANTLGQWGTSLEAGELILSGSVTPLMPAQAGDVFTMALEGVGSCRASFS